MMRTAISPRLAMSSFCMDSSSVWRNGRLVLTGSATRSPLTGLVGRHSLGWVTARDDGRLVGFVNVPWDGLVHAWLQDTMVASAARGQGIGTELVARARAGAREAGCEWLHVDFDEDLEAFYLGACGFTPTKAGLVELQEQKLVETRSKDSLPIPFCRWRGE
jgi:GNAT superfamily N-acetyltransferase